MTDTVAVTGAEGFIGSHLVGGTGPARAPRPGYGPVQHVQLHPAGLRRWTQRSPTRWMWCSGTCATRRQCASWWKAPRWSTTWLRIGSVPYSYSAPRSFMTPTPSARCTCSRRRGTAGPRASCTPHQRDLRDGPDRPDQRVAPAPGPVAVRGVQGRGGQAGRVLLPELRAARGDAAAVQHLRPPAVHPGGHPAGHHPARGRGQAAQLGALDPTRDFCFVTDTARGVHHGGRGAGARRCSARCSTAAPAPTCIGALAEDIAALMGVDADIVEDPKRLRPKDSEVMRLVCDASKLPSAPAGSRGTPGRGPGATIEWFCEPANLARYTRPGTSSEAAASAAVTLASRAADRRSWSSGRAGSSAGMSGTGPRAGPDVVTAGPLPAARLARALPARPGPATRPGLAGDAAGRPPTSWSTAPARRRRRRRAGRANVTGTAALVTALRRTGHAASGWCTWARPPSTAQRARRPRSTSPRRPGPPAPTGPPSRPRPGWSSWAGPPAWTPWCCACSTRSGRAPPESILPGRVAGSCAGPRPGATSGSARWTPSGTSSTPATWPTRPSRPPSPRPCRRRHQYRQRHRRARAARWSRSWWRSAGTTAR